jgi:hypothetical protein
MLEDAITWAYPLAIDEELLKDGLVTTWLSEAADESPKGTIAIQRKTNLGEMVFLNEDFTFDSDSQKLVDNRPEYSPEALAGAPAEEFAFGWATLGVGIAKGLLSGIAGKIGAAIFAQFFKPGVPPYFEQVYQEFRRIVNQAIEENTIRLLVGEVAAIQTQMSAYAEHRRTGNHAPAQEALLEAWNRSVQVTGKLQQLPVRAAGLGPFLTAGGLHLAIIQERALRDTTVNDPNDSSWAKIYIERASEFILYVGSQVDKIVSDRAAHITPVVFVRRVRRRRRGVIDNSYWWYEDTLERAWRQFFKSRGWTLQLAQDQRTNHYNDRIIVRLSRPLEPAREVVQHWRVARDRPLPQVET